VLIIIDRDKDKIAPLRLPWFYQSMIHEHMTYVDGKVDFSVDGKGKDLQDFKEIKSFNLSETHDKFYSENVSSDYGKIARCTTELLSNLKKATPNFQKGNAGSDKNSEQD
jgi:Sec1 family